MRLKKLWMKPVTVIHFSIKGCEWRRDVCSPIGTWVVCKSLHKFKICVIPLYGTELLSSQKMSIDNHIGIAFRMSPVSVSTLCLVSSHLPFSYSV